MPSSNNPYDLINALESKYNELSSDSGSVMASSYNRGEPFDSVDQMEDIILETLGAETFLDALIKALDYDTKRDMYEYIMRCYEIPFDEE